MDFTSTAGHLTLAHAGIRLRAGAPAILVASDDGTSTSRLECQGDPAQRRTRRLTPGGMVEETTWTWTVDGGHSLAWRVGRLEDGTGCTLGMAFRNGGDRPVRLREMLLLDSDGQGLTAAGDPRTWLLTTFAHSRRIGTLGEDLISINDDERAVWAGYGMPVPYPLPIDGRADDGRWRTFTDFLVLAGAGGGTALAIGAVGAPEATVRFSCRVEGGQARIEVASEMSDVLVAPGAWRAAQEVVALGGGQEAISERLLRWCAATHGARTHRGPVAGWCSWYHHGVNVAASDVIALAEAARTRHLPIPVIQVDDGFQRQVGDWACNQRFPEGWAPVIASIRAAGSQPGVWLAPLAVHESTPVFVKHPAWFQRDAAGALSGEAGNWGGRSRWLDPTQPGAAAFIRGIIREHRRAGFTYFKIDFNTVAGVSGAAPGAPRLHDTSRTAFQALRDLYRLYREEIGEDSYLLACIGFNRAVAGFADAARIGPDSSPTWQAAHPCTLHPARVHPHHRTERQRQRHPLRQ
jgi:alpha-galactosidase